MMTHFLQAISPITAGPKTTSAVQLDVPVSSVQATHDVHQRPSPLTSPFADHGDLGYRYVAAALSCVPGHALLMCLRLFCSSCMLCAS